MTANLLFFVAAFFVIAIIARAVARSHGSRITSAIRLVVVLFMIMWLLHSCDVAKDTFDPVIRPINRFFSALFEDVEPRGGRK
jgi:hypothetical protein